MAETNAQNGGILGNTQAQAASDATTARQATKVAWQDNLLTHVGIAITLAVIAFLMMNGLAWNFFLKILVGLFVFWTGGKVTAWAGQKLAWKWPGILRGIGSIIVAATIMQSGFYAMIAQGVNSLENTAAVVAGSAPTPMPKVQKVIWEAGETYSVETGQTYEGMIPPAGIIFNVPTYYKIRHSIEGPNALGAEEMGWEGNVGAKVRLFPKDGKAVMATITTVPL